MLRGLKQNFVHTRSQGPPQETEPDLPLSVWVSPAEAWVSSGLPPRQGLWLKQIWEARHVSPTIEPPELTQDWGNRLLEGTNKTLCTSGSRRKDQWPHKRLTQTCLWVFMSLHQRYGSVVACYRVGSTGCGNGSTRPFEDVSIIFITFTIVWPEVKQQRGNIAPPIKRKLD